MFIFLIIVHVIVSIFLIMVILLQAGRGEGLAESFGGGSVQTIFGTKTSAFLARATTTCAVIFILTSLALDILSGRQGKSVVEKEAPAIMDVKKKLSPVKATETKQETKLPANATPETPVAVDKKEVSAQQTQLPPVAPPNQQEVDNKENTEKSQ
jgi:preprotein translocase subunit SecG